VVQSVRGGAKGGGAQLTDTGVTVLEHYRALEQAATQGGRAELAALRALSADPPPGDMSE
jgi:molybdate transport system regulatory protein